MFDFKGFRGGLVLENVVVGLLVHAAGFEDVGVVEEEDSLGVAVFIMGGCPECLYCLDLV